MTACVNCSRALQPAWKYCIFCGTRTAVAAAAPRSRPIPKRTPVPGYAAVSTVQTPIVPPAAPAPLSAAPSEEPVSSIWPDTMGERPSLRSALAATEVPAPTPPREDGPAPEEFEEFDDEQLPEPEGSGVSIADLAHELDDDDEDNNGTDDESEPVPDVDSFDEDTTPTPNPSPAGRVAAAAAAGVRRRCSRRHPLPISPTPRTTPRTTTTTSTRTHPRIAPVR